MDEPEALSEGTVVLHIWWWSHPDKYSAPRRFRTFEQAKRYDSSGYRSVELDLRTPAGKWLVRKGFVPSVDSIVRDSPNQEEGALPEVDAVVIENIVRPGVSPPLYEIVFRNPDGRFWVLI